jgi:hypothetical protein
LVIVTPALEAPAIVSSFDNIAMVCEAIDWPEPEEGDEDPDPLFDSTRNYMEQLDRYREHQGKPEDASFKLFTLTCQAVGCGRSFQSRYPTAKTCSKACRNKKSRELERARGPRKRDRSLRR